MKRIYVNIDVNSVTVPFLNNTAKQETVTRDMLYPLIQRRVLSAICLFDVDDLHIVIVKTSDCLFRIICAPIVNDIPTKIFAGLDAQTIV